MNALIDASVLQHQLDQGCGYYADLSFQADELQVMRSHVTTCWLNTIQQYVPSNNIDIFLENGIERYHELSHLLDHGAVWSKAARILPQQSVDFIRTTSLIKKLEDIYGSFIISNEENISCEEIYWRLVRPGAKNDIGPLHADAWYWQLGHGVIPPNMKRIKVWVALFCEPNLNGLRVVPYSQKREWKYHSEHRDGFSKPQIDEDESQLDIRLVPTKPGDTIVFHDNLLHGGALNNGQHTRVSLEFTIFVHL